MRPPVIMLDLEEKLLADRDGSLRSTLIVDLCATQRRLHGELRKMNSRDRYLELQGAMQAVTAAVEALQTLSIPSVSAIQTKTKDKR